MTITIITRKDRIKGFIGKTLMLLFLSAIAFTLGYGTIYFMDKISNTRPSSATALPLGWGLNYGIKEFDRTNGEKIDGLQSVTVDFTMEETGDMTLTKTAKHISDTFSTFTSEDIVNVLAHGNTTDTNKKYDIEFYGADFNDYKNGTFNDFVNITNRAFINENIQKVTAISKPDLNGKRNIEFTIQPKTTTFDSYMMKSVWDFMLSSLTDKNLTDFNLYTINIETTLEDKQITISNTFYNPETLEFTETMNPTIWQTTEAYLKSPNFEPYGVTTVQYNHGFNPTESMLQITLTGNGENTDPNTLPTQFAETINNTPEISKPTTYITNIKYEEQANAFYTRYAE